MIQLSNGLRGHLLVHCVLTHVLWITCLALFVIAGRSAGAIDRLQLSVILECVDQVHLGHEARASISAVHDRVTMPVPVSGYSRVEWLGGIVAAGQLAVTHVLQAAHVAVDSSVR